MLYNYCVLKFERRQNMAKSAKINEVFEGTDLEKEEKNRDKARIYKIGHIIRKIHREQGTMPYLIQVIEPHLTKQERSLFGLPF